MGFDSMQWFDPYIIFWIALSFVFNGLVAYLWHKKFYLKLGLKQYQAIQRIHLNETPRLGGLIFITCLIGFAWTSNVSESTNLLKLILLSLTPAIIVALKEDLLQNKFLYLLSEIENFLENKYLLHTHEDRPL